MPCPLGIQATQSSMDPSQLQEIVKLVSIVKYVDASFAILVFDYFQTIEMEVDLIWKAKWGIGKILFLLARYPAFIDVPLVLYYQQALGISRRDCLVIYHVTFWSSVFGVEMAEAILILRTHALWNNRRVLSFLLMLYFAISVSVFIVVISTLRSLRYEESPLSTILGCSVTVGSRFAFANFALLILNEAVVMVLTLWIGVKRFRYSRSRLIVTLYRDGILYFVYLFLISVGNIIVVAAGPPEISSLLDIFQRVMHSLLSARITLHVRDTVQGYRNQDSTSSAVHINYME